PVERQIAAARAVAVAVMRIGPAQLAGERLGVGVEQQLVRVEAVAGARLVGAVDAVAVERAGPNVGQVAVPDLVGMLRQRHAVGLALAGRVEQAQLDTAGMGREQGEVDAVAVPGGAERIGLSRPDRDPRHQPAAPAGWSTSAPSGGRVRLSEYGRPWQG